MGKNNIVKKLSAEQLEDYVTLTYLTKAEILYILKQFHSMAPKEIDQDMNYRLHRSIIMEKFPALKFNPFSDRIFDVFSFLNDDHFSFEDMLDLCSVMSRNCPDKVKAVWAFKIFDLNEDGLIDFDDLFGIMDRLTCGENENGKFLSNEEKLKISHILVSEINLHNYDCMGSAEFYHLITKIPEFKNSFYFTI